MKIILIESENAYMELSSPQQLREERLESLAQLRELVERYHHHLALWKLLTDAPASEIAAWMVNGEKLQRDAEKVIQLK